MKIIPVIDILNGVAVHAVKGKRDEYKPLKSTLCASSSPVEVASAFEKCGFNELYVADLNAILDKGDNVNALNEIRKNTHLQLMVDAGTSNLNQVRNLLRLGVSKVIIGTETLTDLNFVKTAVTQFGNEKIVVSLDLKTGKVQSKSKDIQAMTPLSFARELQSLEVSELIVLDLTKVGSSEGVDFTLLQDMVDSLTLKVLVGGGVRDTNDLTALINIGIYGVLLATALHSGRVSMKTLSHSSQAE